MPIVGVETSVAKTTTEADLVTTGPAVMAITGKEGWPSDCPQAASMNKKNNPTRYTERKRMPFLKHEAIDTCLADHFIKWLELIASKYYIIKVTMSTLFICPLVYLCAF
jgi:hypothetical protein